MKPSVNEAANSVPSGETAMSPHVPSCSRHSLRNLGGDCDIVFAVLVFLKIYLHGLDELYERWQFRSRSLHANN